MSPIIETVAIGDEVISGRISDTNSSFVSRLLAQSGLWIERHNAIGDEIPHIQNILREISTRADFAICFGGLGPTSDDKTPDAIAQLLKCELVEHAESVSRLHEFLKKRGRQLNPYSLKQALYPKATEPILNSNGLAPGFTFRLERCQFFCVPGVPLEMRRMVEESVLPMIASKFPKRQSLLIRTWKCFGIPESELQVVAAPIEEKLPAELWLGYRTKPPENHLTLYGRMGWEKAVDPKLVSGLEEQIREKVTSWCFTEEDKELEKIVVEQLVAKKWTLALAESCTGGLVAHRLTSIPGSSAAFFGGTTVYQVAAKDKLLGVKVRSEAAAVSEATTDALAENLLKMSGADLSVAVTGYMGPAGETKDNPLGTIYISIMGVRSQKYRMELISRERAENLSVASSHVLHQIWLALKA